MALDQLQAFMAALRQMESGGNYRAKGPMTKYGQATGAYQFINSTWGGYGGYKRAMDAPPHIQDQRAAQLMTQYYNTYGDWRLVAIAWHAGPGSANKEQKNPGYAYGIGDVNMRTGAYADKVIAAMGGGGGSYGASDFGNTGFDAGSARDRAKELYGYLGWFVDHPEIGPILLQGAQEGWSKERLQGALVQTRWYQSTSERSRQWDALRASDPATAERQVDETAMSLRLQATQLGIWLPNHRSEQIADKVLRYGWNDQEMRIALSAEMRWRPNSEQGGVGKLMQSVRKLASDYMVPVTRRQEWEWARRMVAGGADEAAVSAQFDKLARQRFPYLAKAMDGGVTPGQYFAGHRDAIAQMLEVSPTSVDLMGTKWAPVTAFRDHSQAKVRPMTVSEAMRFARMKPEWMGTENAWKSSTEAVDSILQTFGAVAR